jgi:hypothetical protein
MTPRLSSSESRQAIWEALRAADAPMTRAQIHETTKVPPTTIGNYLQGLAEAGLVMKADGPGVHPVWSLSGTDTGYHAPRVRRDGSRVVTGDGCGNMWRTMRAMGEFSPRELASHSTTDTVGVSETHAKVYCSKLLAAGFLRVLRKARPGQQQAIYRLVRNTGPRPPVVQRVQRVFDPNNGKFHDLGGGK